MIDWTKSKMTKEEHLLINRIASRSSIGLKIKRDITDISMDLEACNITCPLDFQKLLDSRDFDLVHDIVGIANHLNHDTGELEDCFCLVVLSRLKKYL
jgi:hypothetical protein